MKNFIILLAALTVLGSTAFANVDPKSPEGMAVVKSESGFKLFYRGSSSGDVTITILNSSGKEIYRETLRKIESFMRPYNLSTLKEDEYTVVLESPDGTQHRKIDYSREKPEMLMPMRLNRLAGYAYKYVLSVPNKQNEVLHIKIFSPSNTLLYQETQTVRGDFARIYDLHEIGNNVVFEVTNGNGTTERLACLPK